MNRIIFSITIILILITNHYYSQITMIKSYRLQESDQYGAKIELDKQITLETIIDSNNGKLYISCGGCPFESESTITDKYHSEYNGQKFVGLILYSVIFKHATMYEDRIYLYLKESPKFYKLSVFDIAQSK
jgi:hypothetical protein